MKCIFINQNNPIGYLIMTLQSKHSVGLPLYYDPSNANMNFESFPCSHPKMWLSSFDEPVTAQDSH